MGYHEIRKKKAPIFNSQKPIDRSESVDIWHIEEKKADVNLGVHIIRDVLVHNIEPVIIVSNHTDLLPAIEIAKTEVLRLTVGIIFPISQKSG